MAEETINNSKSIPHQTGMMYQSCIYAISKGNKALAFLPDPPVGGGDQESDTRKNKSIYD